MMRSSLKPQPVGARALLIAAMLQGLAASSALACACCTEPGQRYEGTDRVSTYFRDEIAAIRFAPTASLYAGERGTDVVQGIRAPSDKPYKVTLTRPAAPGGMFTLDAVDAAGQSGRITFAMPQRVTRLEVDPRSDTKAGGNGPTLYKEWRLEAPATLSGIFAAKQSRGTARLILQGRGNSCTASPDFSHWTLVVSGTGVRFSLLGETKP